MSGSKAIAKTHKRHQRRFTTKENDANQPFYPTGETPGAIDPKAKSKRRAAEKAAKKARRAGRKK